MLINFISSPGQDPSNKWRNVFAVVLIVAGVGFTVGPRIGLSDPVVAASNKIFPKILPSYQQKVVVGGDITVDPPKVVVPQVIIPTLIGTLPSAEKFTAKSIFVKDKASHKVLYSKDETSPRPLASVTKLMSSLVLLEAPLPWNATTTVVEGDLSDNHMYAGDVYTMRQLWNAALIASSNKAIKTLVQGAGWEEEKFVARMNEKAKELGMTQTHFVEPTGLDANNISTAADAAILLDAALQKEEILKTLQQKEYTLVSKERGTTHHMWSTDWLLLGWIPYNGFTLVGGKTGFINASGYNFVMQAESDDGKKVNVIVLGAEVHEDRFTEARDIAKEVFKAYSWGDVTSTVK